jgi:hypothetical protein
MTMAYAARKSCGCLVACTVDLPKYAKDTAKDVAKWIRDGLTVERLDVEVVRQQFKSCPHKKVG